MILQLKKTPKNNLLIILPSRVPLTFTCLHPSGILLGMLSQIACLLPGTACTGLTLTHSTIASTADLPGLWKKPKMLSKHISTHDAGCMDSKGKKNQPKQIRKALKHSYSTKENKHLSSKAPNDFN